MDQTLSNAYSMATSSNPIRTNNLQRYQFLYDSYVGGEDYRMGGYLTRYQLETAQDYQLRLQTTPLDNHCRSIIATYISFLFRQEPERDMGSLATEPTVAAFIEDADREGRNLDAVMKQASIWSNVFGHAWLLLSKPDIGAVTMADEISADVRPYLNVLTPLTVTDWTWSRQPNGSYQLTFFKYIEDVNGDVVTIKEWYLDKIVTHVADTKKELLISTFEEVNGLGRIPAVILYAHTSNIRGVGLSTITDLADTQRMIYNMTSEVEQAVRLGSHPSLVKTESVDAGSGAGSIIQMPENMDPALKPYVLEFSGQPIDSIYVSIKNLTDSIDKMANTGSIRATETREMSGVSREVEFQLLNARLSEQADNIELAEEQLWELYAAYQGQIWNGAINYPDSFSIRDTQNELDQLIKAKASVDNVQAKTAIEHEILELLDIDDIVDAQEQEEHPTTTTANRTSHIQTMIMEGYEDFDILSMHPEISQVDINTAKQELLGLNQG